MSARSINTRPGDSQLAAHAALPPWPTRYQTIDAWRGLAALGVVLSHVSSRRGFNFGAECVMLFFVISGYCIAAAAEGCAARGLRFRDFMFRRVKRIYPPYIFAVLFFVATRIAKTQFDASYQMEYGIAQWVQNFTLTQWFTMLATPTTSAAANPANFVAAFWSLQFEEQFYLVAGFSLMLSVAWRFRVLLVLMLLSAAWIAVFPRTFRGLFIEYWLHFAFGCLVFVRLCRARGTRLASVIDVSLVATFALSIVGALVLAEKHAAYRAASRDIALGSGFALLLVALRPTDLWLNRQVWFRPFHALGIITYSLYLVHQFNINSVRGIVGKVIPSHFEWTNMVAQVAVHIAIASVFWYLCERPFLNKSLDAVKPGRRGSSVPAPVSAS